MNDTAAVERWYRRLLAWYPAEHRRAYGEEMIGVLLASAPRGRRRPNLADVADLVKGGLLARLRPVAGQDTDVGWRDSFAVFSIAAPVVVLAYYLVSWAVRLPYQLRMAGPRNWLSLAEGVTEIALALRSRKERSVDGPSLLKQR